MWRFLMFLIKLPEWLWVQRQSQEIQIHEKSMKSVLNVVVSTSRGCVEGECCTVEIGLDSRDPLIPSSLAWYSWEFLFVCMNRAAGLCAGESNTLQLAELETQFHKHIQSLGQDELLRLQRAMSTKSHLLLSFDPPANSVRSFRVSREAICLHFCFSLAVRLHREVKHWDILAGQVVFELQQRWPKKYEKKNVENFAVLKEAENYHLVFTGAWQEAQSTRDRAEHITRWTNNIEATLVFFDIREKWRWIWKR